MYELTGNGGVWEASLRDRTGTAGVSMRYIVNGSAIALLFPSANIAHPDAATYRATAFVHTGDWGQSGPWNMDVSTPVGEPMTPLGLL